METNLPRTPIQKRTTETFSSPSLGLSPWPGTHDGETHTMTHSISALQLVVDQHAQQKHTHLETNLSSMALRKHTTETLSSPGLGTLTWPGTHDGETHTLHSGSTTCGGPARTIKNTLILENTRCLDS